MADPMSATPFVCSASTEEDQPILDMIEMTFSSSAFA
jgi:hypothetical protein